MSEISAPGSCTWCLIGARAEVVTACKALATTHAVRVGQCTLKELRTQRLLIVDAPSLVPRQWQLLRAFSREPDRAMIVIIDGKNVQRSDLALVAADAHVEDNDLAQLSTTLEALSITAQLKELGRRLATDISPINPSLRRALSLLFDGRVNAQGIKTLAHSAAVPQRTLRHQWRTATRGAMRLSQLLRRVNHVRQCDGPAAVHSIRDLERDLRNSSLLKT